MKVIERALLAKGFLTKEALDAKTEHFREHTDEVPTRRWSVHANESIKANSDQKYQPYEKTARNTVK